MRNVDVIVDLQYGSTGKGLIAGFLGTHGHYDTIINANMPNAGHTFIDAKGQKMIHKVLPNGLVGKSVENVGIGPGSVFSVQQLMMELDDLTAYKHNNFKLWIHEDAVVLLVAHKEAEQGDEKLEDIGSTKQGSAAAMIQKIMRNGTRNPTAGVLLREHPYFGPTLLSQREWLRMVRNSREILVEGAQGYSLGINAGFYPFCTSRDCTPARILADCGIPLPYLRRVIGTARMHPIRVGGNSGPCYEDQTEITWEELGQPEERTTVTNKIRRVFTWSQTQMEEAILACAPDHIFLNFCNYAPTEVDKTIGKIRTAGYQMGMPTDVRFLGWGPTVKDVEGKLLDPCDMTRVELGRGNG